MKIEMVEIGEDDVVFSVDGRKVIIPCESLVAEEDESELSLCFYPRQATDAVTDEPIEDQELQNAILAYIQTQFTESNTKFEIDLED